MFLSLFNQRKKEKSLTQRKIEELNKFILEKRILIKELLNKETLKSRFASEEELEILKEHQELKGNGVQESFNYRFYRTKNLDQSADWDLKTKYELSGPKEIREIRSLKKKNQ